MAMEHKVDRELPEEVVEHILSFIPIEQVVQSSIFSKRWKCVWTRFPIWGFDEMYIKAPFVSTENVFCKTFSAFAGVCCNVK
jgi:hypothetical protein